MDQRLVSLCAVPTYDYACRNCDHRFEAVQSIHDDALTVCPDCGGELRKVVSAVGIQFKGSGFYRTDSRKESKGASAASKPVESTAAKKEGASSGSGEASSTEPTTSKKPDSSSPSGAGASSGSKGGDSPAGSASSSGADKKK